MKTDSCNPTETSPACRVCPLRRASCPADSRPSPHYFAKNASNLLKALKNLKDYDPCHTRLADHLVDYNNPLSVREYEILYLSAKGLTNQAISDMLSISHHTVKSHFDSIFNKLGVHNRILAVVWALRQGFF